MVVGIVVTQRAIHVGLVPQVENRVAAHVHGRLLSRRAAGVALQPQARAKAPVGLEILGNLFVDGAYRALHFLVADLARGEIDDGDDHGVVSLKICGIYRLGKTRFRETLINSKEPSLRAQRGNPAH
jgi:hypothetical protein